MNHYAVENLFGIEGLNIAWYGIIITFGMILGFMLALRRCKKTGVEPDHLYNLVLWLIPSLVLGQAIGRWGNFVNQEAYGNLITNPDLQFFPYGVYIEELGQ
jgi:phosphatidylglycerol:prolipoprotein diacylglycerol transferase